MKKILFLLSIMLFVLVDVQAQMRFTIYVRNANGAPLEGVTVSSFPLKKNGSAAYNEAKNNYGLFDGVKYNMLEQVRTESDGSCIVKALSTGSVMLDGGSCVNGEYDILLFNIEDYRENDHDYTLEVVLSGKEYVKNTGKTRKIRADQMGEFANSGESTRIDEVEARGGLSMPPPGTKPTRFGKNNILITATIDIPDEHARDDARFVAFPTIIFHDYKDSVVNMPPAVVQGKGYGKSMERRMSYDVSRDKLNGYKFDASTYLTDNQSERILYSEWAHIKKGTKYHIPGLLWFEDYNGVYNEDSLLFSDGNEREPMRFLNWDAARKMAPIDRSLFAKRGTYEPVNEAEDFKLKFEQGKGELNLRDSATVHERDSMIRWLAKYYHGEGEIQKVTVRGYSSPEGTEARNRTLSQERARTIQQLLKSHFPNVTIVPEFNEHYNIVPWEEVADVMLQMEDTLARSYALEIRKLIADKTGFDAQYRAIRANDDLFDYLDEHVLDIVRVVQIEASVVVQKILTKDEIVERYQSNPDFRERMVDYQYYTMMCHLADKEDWDELYTVSQKAYKKMNKDKRAPKQILVHPSDTALTTFQTLIPYPLAGYYYAVSSIRKGLVDTEILKPYLDDYKVGVRDNIPLNSLPFIVAQVLMYCEEEEFDGASELIGKYNLSSFPELEGLVMFVLCLDGQFDNPKVRNYVMSTSPMNKAVMLCAMEKYREALEVLYSSHFEGQEDADVEYLKAICHFQSQPSTITDYKKKSFTGSEVYSPDATPGIDTEMWAAPMLKAFELDEDHVKYIETDGYFNNAYRQMLLYFHKRLKDGVAIDKVLAEYKALVARMPQN